jgi:hypothetical protein
MTMTAPAPAPAPFLVDLDELTFAQMMRPDQFEADGFIPLDAATPF